MKPRSPELPKGHVIRPRLVNLLERGAGAALTLVAAPAGYGKTTLLAAWIGVTSRQAAWLTLDQQDNEAPAFLWDLVGSIQRIAPSFGRPILGPVARPGLSSARVVAASLVQELAGLEQRVIVVLDDYQVIVNPEVHATVAALLQRLPQNVQLVLATRDEPPLPLGLLRARGRLLELGVEQLRFRPGEVEALLSRALGERLSAGLGTALEQDTEGWAAGLRLAVLALESEPDPINWPGQSRQGSRRHVQQLLLDEVLEQQPAEVQQLLLRTSICERFCADLGQVLLVETGAAAPVARILEQLQRKQLVIVEEEPGRRWYRCRGLLREALYQRLQVENAAAAILALRRGASAWFAREGLADEALAQALAAGDPLVAAEVVERAAQPTLNREDWPRLERWLELLPADLVQQRPGLLLARLWVLYFRYQYAALPPLLDVVDGLLAHDHQGPDLAPRQALRAEADTLRSLIAALQDEPRQARELAERALQHLPDESFFVRGVAELLLGLARHSLGESVGAVCKLEEACAGQVEPGPARSSRLLLGLAHLHLLSCDLQAAARAARQLLAVAQAHNLPTSAAWGLYLIGRVHYELNELTLAAGCFRDAAQLQPAVHHQVVRDCLLSLALTQQALGEDREAETTVQSLAAAPAAAWMRDVKVTWACQARLAFLRGDLAAAITWAHNENFPVEGSIDSLIESPSLIRARLLIIDDIPGAKEQAAQILAQLSAIYSARHDDLRWIRCQIVGAVLLWSTGEIDAALDRLGQIVDRARGGGLVRTFIELGPPLRGLLLKLKRRALQPDPYLERLLAAFPATSGPAESAAPSRRDTQPDLVDPLTWRELEILGLLAGRLSNKEVARSLKISPETVKKHTINIYQKLMVPGRREAVSRAQGLGLIGEQKAEP